MFALAFRLEDLTRFPATMSSETPRVSALLYKVDHLHLNGNSLDHHSVKEELFGECRVVGLFSPRWTSCPGKKRRSEK
jgi:hypothetical protein